MFSLGFRQGRWLLVRAQEGVVAPPEETFFDCADSDVTPSLTFETFDEIEQKATKSMMGPSSSIRSPKDTQRPVLLVEELEKQFQAASLKPAPPLTVSELEAQMYGAAAAAADDTESHSVGWNPPRFTQHPGDGLLLRASLMGQQSSSIPWLRPSPQSASLLSSLTQVSSQLGSSGSSVQGSSLFMSDFQSTGFASISPSLLRSQESHLTGYGGGGGGSLGLNADFSMFTGGNHTQKYKFMTASEIEKILACQVQNTHVQNPYSDDYYYHAFMKKYRRGSVRFSPLSIKELEHQEQNMKAEVKFADLQGLGKIPFSNLRTPRPLIDFLDNESLASAEEEAGLQSIQWEYIRLAQRAQAMHARKLIEDAMCLLLEVDDVDRLAMSECGKIDLRKLAARRRDLIGSIVAAFRIPSTPEGVASGGRFNGDGVFLRLMSIAKGRSLLAKLLNVLVPPRPFQALPTDTKPLSHICWTTLRNIRALFGPTTWITKAGIDVDLPTLSAETSKIAVGLKEVILTLKSATDVCKAFEALAKGDLMSSDGSVVTPEELLLPFLPPNHVPGCKTGIWLEAVLVALLQRALEVGLAQRISFTHTIGAYTDFELMKKWEWVFGVLYGAVTAHLKILVQVHRVAKERNQPQALEYAKGLLGKDLLSATLMLCDQLQFSSVKQIVNALLEWS